MQQSIKIKVCGMKFAANIAEIAALKPDYMGFIFYDKSPRYISTISSELILYVPKEIKTVGVFVDEEAKMVKLKIATLGLQVVQLHGKELPEYCAALKLDFPNVEIIKAFGVDEDFNFSDLSLYLEVVDFFLFDTKTTKHGGSGKQFDWTTLENYKLDKPYFLSGGIDLEDLYAIKKINDKRLVAIDINSKFELEPGKKNVEKTKEIIAGLREI
ncbi:phosphoribosylanthranilate isomerase [Pedobacter sp. UYP30]|uniref:phosphoribosylanthranilate isomerase n=1 Tax=Pedobacter sp. UYP30 TaxID=1756400 RepID=UPI003392AF40